MANITLQNIQKDYSGTKVLHDINIQIEEGEFVVLIGESGCGKSTLLRMICGLEEISSGELLIDGTLSNTVPPQKRDMAMVFQSYALYPHMTIYDNIAYGLTIQKRPKAEIERKVQDTAKLLGIEMLLDRLPKNLSGGQRQRVAMGRAIIRDPKFFLFDEPLSNLDAKLRVIMRKEIKLLQKRLGTTTIYVTHDQIEAMTMADKIVLMDKGLIVQIGTPCELYDHPNSIFTATFLGSPGISLIHGSIKTSNGVHLFYSEDEIIFPIEQLSSLKDGQKVILGIRPRDINISTENDGLEVNVTIHEYTGAENIIYGTIGQSEITVAFSRKEDFAYSDTMHINYNIARSHLFDAQSGNILK